MQILDHRCLSIIRYLIEAQNPAYIDYTLGKESSRWRAKHWKKHKHKIKAVQDMLIELPIVEKIRSVIVEPDIPEHRKLEAIHLSIMLLLGGNKRVQEKFYESLS